jgi:hypothetical protein
MEPKYIKRSSVKKKDLTPCREVLLGNMIDAQLVQKFPFL